MKKRWSEIKRGDVVDLGGRDWTVEKIKLGKRKATVRIRHKSNVADSKVALTDKVRIAEKSAPQRSRSGVSRPSAEPKKAEPQQTTPPKAAKHGDPWETQQDRIEQKLDEILGARLVGEATDAEVGYFVPPVDVTTIASHLLIFHDIDPRGAESEAAMLKAHGEEHARALDGTAELATNHWHTEKRPTKAKH